MLIRNPKDLISGLIFLVLGVAVYVYAQRYGFGTTREMGPGYFPQILGVGLAGLGAMVALLSLKVEGPRLERIQLRPLLSLVMVVVFALVVEKLGLLLSTLLLVGGSSVASREFRTVESVIWAIVLAAFAAVVFVWALGVQLYLLPTFLR